MINGISSNNINGIIGSAVNGVTIEKQGILFATTGTTFNPLITLNAEASVRWEFDDNTTSSSLSPDITFAVGGDHSTKLVVTPWAALQRINLGYGHDDGGSEAIPDHPVQPVTAIGNLSLVRETLVEFCASRCPLTSISFRDFTALETLEMFSCQTITGIDLYGTTNLRRTTIEDSDNNTTPPDFSASPNIYDIRFSRLECTHAIWAETDYEALWHLCCGLNPQFTENLPFDRFPVLAEVYTHGNNQTGHLAPSTDRLSFFRGENNNWTTADFTGCFSAGPSAGNLYLQGNNLTSLIIDNCPNIDFLNCQDNNFGVAAVNAILQSLDDQGGIDGTVDLSQQTPAAIPTNTTAIASLEGKGWTVTVDS